MIHLTYSTRFEKGVLLLPWPAQKKLSRLLVTLVENPFDPRLHTKRLSGSLEEQLSFRITRDFRVLFQFIDTETIQLLRVAHRKDVYR